MSTIDHHSRALDDLRNQDIHALVATFIQSNGGQPLVGAVVSLLDKIAANADLQHLIGQLLSTLADPHFYNGLFNALKAHVEAHPWPTAFFIIGIVLMCSPLAMAGFGSLGPVAGKFMVFVFPLPTDWKSMFLRFTGCCMAINHGRHCCCGERVCDPPELGNDVLHCDPSRRSDYYGWVCHCCH
ncbi:hypothetical protein L208DRAFT_52268 [Tricholoma matsutake]|nr:hypothetical protein L208DRAFT_52268 [Tricholoma matsutake 945]